MQSLNEHIREQARFQSQQQEVRFSVAMVSWKNICTDVTKTIMHFVFSSFSSSLPPCPFLPSPSVSSLFDFPFLLVSVLFLLLRFMHLFFFLPLFTFHLLLFFLPFPSSTFSHSTFSSYSFPLFRCLPPLLLLLFSLLIIRFLLFFFSFNVLPLTILKNLIIYVTFTRTHSARNLLTSPRLESWICSELPTWGRTPWSYTSSGSAYTSSTTVWCWILSTSGETFT